MNKGIISKTGLLGIAGWATVVVLAVLLVRREPEQGAARPEGELQLAEGVFEHTDAEHIKNLGPVTEEDWKATDEFLARHAPHRHEQMKVRMSQRGANPSLKHYLVNRWRSINELKNTSPELYETRVHEVEADDEIFRICRAIQRNGATPALKSELKVHITDLFNLGLEKRKLRIKVIEQSLAVQKNKLTADENDKANLIEKQVAYVANNGVEGAKIGFGRHGGPKNGSSTGPSQSPGDAESNSPLNVEP